MEHRDIDLISPQASPDQVDAIISRSARGHVGTVCPPREVRESIYYDQGNERFRWFRHFLRYCCD